MTEKLQQKVVQGLDDLIEYKSRLDMRRAAASTGPVLIKGTPNVSLKARSLKMTPLTPSQTTKDESGTPLVKTSSEHRQDMNLPRHQAFLKKVKGFDDFAAFEWEEIDREADREWYDQEEGGDYVDEMNADK